MVNMSVKYGERRRCVECRQEYTLRRDKPGKITQCYKCGRKAEAGHERLGGNMIWAHKTGPEIEIKPLSKARKFARMTERFGAGVTKSITVSKDRCEREVFGGDE